MSIFKSIFSLLILSQFIFAADVWAQTDPVNKERTRQYYGEIAGDKNEFLFDIMLTKNNSGTQVRYLNHLTGLDGRGEKFYLSFSDLSEKEVQLYTNKVAELFYEELTYNYGFFTLIETNVESAKKMFVGFNDLLPHSTALSDFESVIAGLEKPNHKYRIFYSHWNDSYNGGYGSGYTVFIYDITGDELFVSHFVTYTE